MVTGKRVAVIGSGITGLSSAWILHRNGAKVTLYEKEESCGGHTLTDTSSGYPVDLGFQVYNLTTYPNLVGFFECLGVDTEPSDMSFALSMDDGKLEWGSDNLDSIFAQRKNIVNPRFLSMLYDVIRFGKEAPKVLEPANSHVYRDMTLGEYLKQHKYSDAFTTNYVVPMCAAVWSVPSAQVLAFPVQMLIRFWVNHHLLDIFQRPLWRVVKGRSQEYVKKVVAELPDVRTSTPVASVVRPRNGNGPVVVTSEAGAREEFDAVVFATHSDITLRILGQDIDEAEHDVLEAIPYNDNDVYLHTDDSLMPRNRKTWASWNFIGKSDSPDTSAVCVSYWANRLQELPAGAPNLFVTLNPPTPPAKDKTFRRLSLAHPVFSFASVAAQGKVAELQGHRGTFYAGAWCGYGFHEDGIKAAVEAVKAMGGSIPWEARSVSPKMTMFDSLYMNLFDKYASSTFSTGYLRIILPNGYELRYGNPHSTAAPVPKGEEWRGRPRLSATLRVFSFDFFRKVVTRHDTGLGEAYMDRDFEADDLGALIAVIVANAEATESNRGALGLLNWLGDRLLYVAHLARPNTIEGSRKNIEEHYDAGNAMYSLFLDETMTYSSGIHHKGESLYQAQLNKIDAIIKQAEIKKGDHVLEIGCGWGGFAIRAAQTTGCRVTGLTLSKEQLAEATARVKAAGLEEQVTLLFCDYRDCPGAGTYDKVVSIEMIEAVGHEHLKPYFATIGHMLKPGGRAVIQAISCPDERYEAYCRCSDFIREHIFPGGHLPSMGAMVEAARGTGLSVHGVTDIGPDYAITLREWRKRWEERKEDILKLGYSARFWRKYRFYFAFCEGGFDGRYIHNFHVVWVKDGKEEAPRQQQQGQGQGQAQQGALRSLGGTVSEEMPSDPVTQALLALYFFMAGMLVKSHALMWLLPAVSCLCAGMNQLLHRLSLMQVSQYRFLTPDRQAWWCADVAHVAYSSAAALGSALYLMRHPAALFLSASLTDVALPSVLACASTGFFAFHLWVCVRYRLYALSLQPIIQYTLMLVLVGVAAYKGVGLPLLAAALIGEAASVPYLIAKLQRLAGVHPNTKACRVTAQVERVALMVFRVVPHALMTLLLVFRPRAVGLPNAGYHVMALVGMLYCNLVNWQRAKKAGLVIVTAKGIKFGTGPGASAYISTAASSAARKVHSD